MWGGSDLFPAGRAERFPEYRFKCASLSSGVTDRVPRGQRSQCFVEITDVTESAVGSRSYDLHIQY